MFGRAFVWKVVGINAPALESFSFDFDDFRYKNLKVLHIKFSIELKIVTIIFEFGHCFLK